MEEDFENGVDNFKASYIKAMDYDKFLSKLQNHKYGSIMRDSEVYKHLKNDIILPEFIEKYSTREHVEIIQGR